MNEKPQVTLAKSNGITLKDHTQHLRDQFREHIYPAHTFAADKYIKRTGGDLAALTLQSIKWHDFGKKDSIWQGACQKDYLLWKAWDDAGRKGPKPRGQHLMKSNLRHEMASLVGMEKNDSTAPRVVRVAIAAHHAKLGEKYADRWRTDNGGAYRSYWKAFNGIADEVDYTSEWKKALSLRYEYDGPRSLLQLADHRASAGEEASFVPNFIPFHYKFPEHYKKRGPQLTIEELWDEPVALLRAATGAGKTDAALIWAKHQIEQKRGDRLVIAMPTRFTANALAITNASNLSETGLYHSSAWHQRREDAKDTKSFNQIDAEQELARLLETSVTVTTIDHLCLSLTATREDHHAIFFNLAHSCVVIDEADFYDAFTQANLIILLDALRLLDVPVLLMSATLPESCKTLYSVEYIHEDTTGYNTERCALKRCAKPVVEPSDIADLLKRTIGGTPTIIYANTVQRAQRYYRYLKRRMPASEVILYHSRFTEPDKTIIEERLREMLGRDAWRNGTVHGVAVLTQIGELSVNISADYMISDLCPLDRLVQRVGRLSRFPESHLPGELHVVLPYKKNKVGEAEAYPAPYGTYRNGWQPAPALTQTDRVLKEKNYTPQEFVHQVNALYESVPDLTVDARENQRKLLELIGMNWLIQKENPIDEDAEQTKDWMCRDIPQQYTVLVGVKMDSGYGNGVSDILKNWREWRTLQLKYGVNCHAYEFHKAVENGLIETVTFQIGESGGSKKQLGYLAHADCYDTDMGLTLADPEDLNEEDEE